jgi:hypothetical protein
MAQTDDDLKQDKKLLAKAEAAEAAAKQLNHESQQRADDDGMPVQSDRPTGSKDLEAAFDRGVQLGYSTALNDLVEYLDRQQKIHKGSLPRVNL